KNPDSIDKNDPENVQLQDKDIMYDIASSVEVMGLEVRRVHLEVTEHPDSDSGKREFKPLINFSELTLQWQKKMHFLLSSMSMVYMLTTPMPKDGGDNPTVEQVRKRAK
ncbi:hypothetical protein Tco_1209018, partial [Tanacetum coccineum]